MNRSWLAALLASAVAALVLANALFIVDQRRQAVVVGLAGPMRVINPAGADDTGVKLKLPFVQWVVNLDRRSQGVETAQTPVTTADHQPLLLDAYVSFRIVDPMAFFRTLGDETTVQSRLSPLIAASLGQAIGQENAAAVISGGPPAGAASALADLRARAAGAHLGVEVADLRITRVALPAAAAAAVEGRMTNRLRRQAMQIRAQGEASRGQIIAAADGQASVILAKANEQASAVRGAGDAQADQLYAAAYGQDPRFAAFYRTMRAYRDALARKDVSLVVSPDSDFFKYFRQGPKAK